MRTKLPWILLAISMVLNVFAVGGFIYAKQRGDGRMMRHSVIMESTGDLNLTAAQKDAFEKMRNDIRKSSSDIRDEMRPLRRELLSELAKPQPDFSAVDRKIDDLGDVQGKRFKAMVRAVHEFQQTLSPEQQEKFRKNIRDNSSRRGERRRDGNPPPSR